MYRLWTDGKPNVLITGANTPEEALERGIKTVTRQSETGERSCDFTTFELVQITSGYEIDVTIPVTAKIIAFPQQVGLQRKVG